MKKAVLSLSGGLDSTSLLVHLLANDYQVKAYSFFYGQKHQVELERAKKNIELLMEKFPSQLLNYQVINLVDVFDESKSALTSDTIVPEEHYSADSQKITVVENRNKVFASVLQTKALSWANSIKENVVICLGIHLGDESSYPDCRLEWREADEKSFKIGNWNSELVDYYTPFITGDKRTIVAEVLDNCKKLNLSFTEVFSQTNTCYQPDSKGRSCGRCGSCLERLESMIFNNIVDPVTYQQSWEKTIEHAKKALTVV